MIKKNEKGFTLILSLVLLLAMSLMGGGLIVISSSDHQSNNSSDEFQQTFYVAEHGLMEAQKSLINKMMGPVQDDGSRNEDIRSIPTNVEKAISNLDQDTPCYKSFRNLSRADDFKYVEHVKSKKFVDLFDPDEAIVTDDNERKKLSEFTYEYFSVNSGTQIYKAVGSSLKKTSSTAQRQGSTFKIYGCGMMGDTSKPEILIPLETIIVLSH